MSSHSQLQGVQQEIDSAKAEIQQTKQDLAKARADNDAQEVDFLRKRLEQLDKEKNSLREKENILLRAQAPGQQCLPCHHPAGLAVYNCLRTSCGGSFSTPCCPLNVALIYNFACQNASDIASYSLTIASPISSSLHLLCDLGLHPPLMDVHVCSTLWLGFDHKA